MWFSCIWFILLIFSLSLERILSQVYWYNRVIAYDRIILNQAHYFSILNTYKKYQPLNVINKWYQTKYFTWDMNLFHDVFLLSFLYKIKYTELNFKGCIKISIAQKSWHLKLARVIYLKNAYNLTCKYIFFTFSTLQIHYRNIWVTISFTFKLMELFWGVRY